MKYVIVCAVSGRSENAAAFDTRSEAVNYVTRIMRALGYGVDANESKDGMWLLSESGIRVKFLLDHVEASHLHYWLRRHEEGRHTETRRFKSRNTAVRYAQETLHTTGSSGLEFGLRLVIESTKRSKEDCVALGVSEDADETVIKAAYRAKLKTAHPDVGGSEDAVKRLNAAYERLMSPGSAKTHREEYLSMDEGELTNYLQTALHRTEQRHASASQTTSMQPPASRSSVKSRRNDGFLDRLPDWLRWVLAWPAGIIGSLIAGYLVRLVWGITSPDDTNALLDLAQAGVMGFFWVFIPTLFAPKGKKTIAVISLCLLIGLLFLLLGIAVFISLMGYEVESPGAFYLGMAAYIIGAVIATVNTSSETS